MVDIYWKCLITQIEKQEFSNNDFEQLLLIFNSKNKIDDNLKDILIESIGKIKQKNMIDFQRLFTNNLNLVWKSNNAMADIKRNIYQQFKQSQGDLKKRNSITLYEKVVQGPFFECLTFLMKIIDSSKVQRLLNPSIEYLASKRLKDLGLKNFTDYGNGYVRNAIDHSKFDISSDEFIFYPDNHPVIRYTEDGFYRDIEKLIIATNTFMYTILFIGKNEGISIKECLDFQSEEKLDLLKILLTSYKTECISAELSVTPVNSFKQLNIDFNGQELSEQSRIFFMIIQIIRAFLFTEKCNIHIDRFFLTHRTPNTLPNFIYLFAEDVIKFLCNKISLGQLVEKIISNGAIYENNNDDTIGIQQSINYENVQRDGYSIREITDISTKEEKRFSARVIVEKADSREIIKKIALKVIKELKMLVNFKNQHYKTKYGSMEADVIIFNIFKVSDDFSLFESNNNFIAMVQYDVSKNFIINNDNKYLNYLDNDIDDFVQYRWNPKSI